MALAKAARSVKVKISQLFPDYSFDDPLLLTERIENVSPYTLTGDTLAGVKPFVLDGFTFNTLAFTPYAEKDGKGIEGPTLAVVVVSTSCLFEENENPLCRSAEVIGVCEFGEQLCPVLCGLCD